MKKILKALLIIVLVLLVFIVVFATWYLTFENREVRQGETENAVIAQTIDTNLNIVYMGDSLTNGYLSDGQLHPEDLGYRDDLEYTLGATGVNYAVGGYMVPDLQKQLDDDVNLSSVNSVIIGNAKSNSMDNIEQLENVYPQTLSYDPTISESIEQADYVVVTIGANDVIDSLLTFDENGKMSVQKKGIIKNLEYIRDQKISLYEDIHEINPDVQIIDVGMYFSYPHQGDMFIRLMSPILAFAESYILIDQPENNIHKVVIRDNMLPDIKNIIDNPSDIHPNADGYDIMANEIAKTIIELEN